MPEGTEIVYRDHAANLLNFAVQLVPGVMFLHERGIAHLDIKKENLVVSRTGKLSIIDFSISQFVESNTSLTGFWGTRGCVAPEIEKGKPFSPFLADSWACGRILKDMAHACSGWQHVQAIELAAEYLTRSNPLMRPPLRLVLSILDLHQLTAAYHVDSKFLNPRKRKFHMSQDYADYCRPSEITV